MCSRKLFFFLFSLVFMSPLFSVENDLAGVETVNAVNRLLIEYANNFHYNQYISFIKRFVKDKYVLSEDHPLYEDFTKAILELGEHNKRIKKQLEYMNKMSNQNRLPVLIKKNFFADKETIEFVNNIARHRQYTYILIEDEEFGFASPAEMKKGLEKLKKTNNVLQYFSNEQGRKQHLERLFTLLNRIKKDAKRIKENEINKTKENFDGLYGAVPVNKMHGTYCPIFNTKATEPITVKPIRPMLIEKPQPKKSSLI